MGAAEGGGVMGRNPFRRPVMAKTYDAMLRLFAERHRDFFVPGGSRRYGSSIAGTFWRGYDGLKGKNQYVSRADKDTLGYVYWIAGRDCAAADKVAGSTAPHVSYPGGAARYHGLVKVTT